MCPNTEIALNAYEMTEIVKRGLTSEYLENEKIFWKEVEKFGRFWLMEYYFPPDDRDKWLEAIEILSNVNKLVQQDLRDMIVLRNDKIEFGKKISTNNISVNDNNQSENSEERKHSKDKSKEKNKMKKHQSSKKTILSHKGVSPRKSIRKGSVDSNEEKNILPKNIENLRPPHVWNYPVERIEKLKNEKKKKKEDKDNNEIDLIRHEKKILLERLILIFVIMIKD